MKRWALLTISLYAVSVTALAVPMFLLLAGTGGGDLLEGFYLYFLPFLLMVQAALLLVPADAERKRPVGRRKIIAACAMGALPMAALVLAAFGSAVLLLWGEDATHKHLYSWPILIVPAVFWPLWASVFFKVSSRHDPLTFTATLCSWLLKGSILELLVAVPSHIVSRQREECCAPPLTFLGIVTGVSIALLSFGPGVFVLFVKRIRRKRRCDGPVMPGEYGG